ncbi:unnamed protein product [Urochloa humidicola]
MAAELLVPEVGVLIICVAVGGAEILKPLFGFLEGAPARGPALDAAAAAAAILALPVAYLAGVTLIYLHVTQAAGAPAALWPFAVLISSVLLFMALILFLAAGSGR